MPMSANSKMRSDERLLRAAQEELISNNGHMEMLSVAKRAGVAAGLAYHYFGSKSGLIAAVVADFYQPLTKISLGHPIANHQTWLDREHDRTAALIDYFYDHPMAPLIAGRLSREPEVLDVEQSHMDALLLAGAKNIVQGQASGVVASALDPNITVAVLMGGLRQAINSAITTNPRPSRALLLKNIWRLTVNALQINETQNQASHSEPTPPIKIET